MASRIGAWRQSWDWGALILRAVLGVSIFLHGILQPASPTGTEKP